MFLLWTCLFGLAVIIGGALMVQFAKVMEWIRRHRWQAVWLAPFVIACYHLGATKGRITYPRTDLEVAYLTDNGSFITNDYFSVNFTRSPIVPTSAWFYFEICPLSVTNQNDWAANAVTIYSNTFANITLPLVINYANATNYNAMGYTDWVPPPVTHTNGVACVVWQQAHNKSINDLALYRTPVYTNAFKVAPNTAITNGPAIPATLGNFNSNGDEE